MKSERRKMAARPSEAAEAAGAGTSGLKITSLETWNGQQQNVSLNPSSDPTGRRDRCGRAAV
jgi:hypothetical protein